MAALETGWRSPQTAVRPFRKDSLPNGFRNRKSKKKFPWPTPHAADPSLCSMSFLGTSWHDLICIGSLVFSY